MLVRAMVPFQPALAPDLSGRAVLLSEGRQDPLVPPGDAERLAQILSTAGADVELVWQPGGHGLTQGDVTAARRWLSERTTRPATA
jgi:phospholipase/carboxylesterase